MVFPVAPPRPCCANTRQSKRPKSGQIVHGRICDNLLSSLFIYLFSDNSPTISWVERMACRSSLVAEQLIRVLALRFNIQKVCPITTLHIAGDQNSMTNIPSRLFGSEHKWHFKSEHDLLTFFSVNFTLPLQNSWTVCQPTSAIATRVISVLRMTPFILDDWRRLPAAGKKIGTTGKSTRLLWE